MRVQARNRERVVTTFRRFDSPVGELVLTASDSGLTGVYFPTSRHGPPRVESWMDADRGGAAGGGGDAILARACQQLLEYFAGTRTAFEVPLAASGTTFEQRVWELLRAIPYGTTTSYGALARRLGDPRATRAVGAANGKNPIPIIVPCHRVVGARGELTGFGGGIDRKRWLLEHEGALMRLGS
jgi:methylated-DNA-[protein]-cysteine S-methyltransferase